MPRSLAPGAVVLAALCFATTGTAQALADVDASPVAVGAARILIGGAVLGVIALVGHLRRAETAPAVPDRPGPLGRVPSWLIVAIGALGVLSYQPAFFAGTGLNGVAVGTVIALGWAPVATGLIDAAIRRRVPSGPWWIATGIALGGVVLVAAGTGGIGGGSMRVTPLGVAASLGAGASYAVYAVASKILLDRGWRPAQAMGAIFGVAATLSLPVLLTASTSWLLTPPGLWLALWLGVVTTAVAYLLFGWGLQRLSAGPVATLTLAEPVGAALLGVVVLGEHLGALSAVGLLVICVGVTLVSIPASPRRTDVTPQT